MKLMAEFKFIFLSVLASLLFAGCATAPEFTKARDAYSQGNYKLALENFEAALPKANSQAQKKQISERIVEIRERITQADLEEARQRLAGGPTIPSLVATVQFLKSELRYDNASHALAEALTEHIALLEKSTLEYNSALSAAAAAENTSRWSEAYSNLASARKLNPSPELSKRIENLVARRDATVPAEIRQQVNSGNLERAESLLGAYINGEPKPRAEVSAELRLAVDALRQKVLEARFQDFIAAKKYYTAYQLILDSKRDYLDRQLSRVCSEGAAYYLEKARQEKGDPNRLGYAYFAAEKAWELVSRESGAASELNNAIFVLRREISDEINSAIQNQIAVVTFSSPTVEPQAGVALANALVQHLSENRPYGIEIIERQKVENLKDETGDRGARVKMFIVGDLTTLNVERKRSEREGTVSVVKGTRHIPNPAYSEYVRLYGNEVKKWPSEFRGTPPLITENENEVVKYKLGQEILNGVMVASVRAFESALGTVKWAKDFKSEQSKVDTFSDPVPIAVPPISLDALELPTDNEVKEILRKELAQQIGNEVLKSFEHREQRFLDSAKVSLQRREMPQAVVDLAGGYFYAYKDARYIPDPAANPAVSELRRLGFFECTE